MTTGPDETYLLFMIISGTLSGTITSVNNLSDPYLIGAQVAGKWYYESGPPIDPETSSLHLSVGSVDLDGGNFSMGLSVDPTTGLPLEFVIGGDEDLTLKFGTELTIFIGDKQGSAVATVQFIRDHSPLAPPRNLRRQP